MKYLKRSKEKLHNPLYKPRVNYREFFDLAPVTPGRSAEDLRKFIESADKFEKLIIVAHAQTFLSGVIENVISVADCFRDFPTISRTLSRECDPVKYVKDKVDIAILALKLGADIRKCVHSFPFTLNSLIGIVESTNYSHKVMEKDIARLIQASILYSERPIAEQISQLEETATPARNLLSESLQTRDLVARGAIFAVTGGKLPFDILNLIAKQITFQDALNVSQASSHTRSTIGTYAQKRLEEVSSARKAAEPALAL